MVNRKFGRPRALVPCVPSARLVSCLLALPVVAGCGGGTKPDAQGEIRAVLASYAQARDRDDARQACGELLVIREEGRKPEIPGAGEADADAKAAEGDAGSGEAAACERDFRRTTALARSGLKAYSERIRAISVRDQEAVVRADATFTRADGSRLTRPAHHDLLRIAGRWRIIIQPVG